MKGLKTKLIASVVMLAVAAVMLTSASFAWYTVSTKGEISKIDVTMKATENLEVARVKDGTETVPEPKTGDTTDDTKWGSTVYNWTTAEKLDYPATVSESKIKTMDFDKDNRLTSLKEANLKNYDGKAFDGNGMSYYVVDLGADNNKLEGLKVASVYGVWIRTNVAEADVKADITNTSDATVMVIDPEGNAVENGGTFTLKSADGQQLVKIVAFFDGTDLKAENVINNLDATGIEVVFTSEDVHGIVDRSATP